MRGKQTRRRFSRAFKLEAVRQLEAGQRLAEVARQLDVNPTVLRRWKDQLADEPETAFPGNGRRHWTVASLYRMVGITVAVVVFALSAMALSCVMCRSNAAA